MNGDRHISKPHTFFPALACIARRHLDHPWDQMGRPLETHQHYLHSHYKGDAECAAMNAWQKSKDTIVGAKLDVPEVEHDLSMSM